VWYDPASGLTTSSQPGGQLDADLPTTPTAAAAAAAAAVVIVDDDGRLIQNGRGDGVASQPAATTGVRARKHSTDLPPD